MADFFKFKGVVWHLYDATKLERGHGVTHQITRIDHWDDGIPKVGSEYAIPCDHMGNVIPKQCKTPEKSGGSVDYYQVRIEKPTTKGRAVYTAECNDIIEALGMNYAEGNAFKAIWRSCAERTLGKKKAGGNAVYDAEKVVFFGERMLAQRKEIK